MKLTLLDILIEFFISTNYEFSQIVLLEVCTQGILNIKIIFKQHKTEMCFLTKNLMVNNISKQNSSTLKLLSASGSSAN